MIQDVVYNHLGPSGNYLPEFFPVFAEGGANTWGSSINLSGPDSDEVRRYILDNARMWFADYHVDALRLDAVHALVDTRATHLLEEMVVEVDQPGAQAPVRSLGHPVKFSATPAAATAAAEPAAPGSSSATRIAATRKAGMSHARFTVAAGRSGPTCAP